MKRLTVFLLVLVFCLTAMPFSGVAVGEEKAKTYYQFPVDKTLPAGSMWNPLVTTKDGKKVSETYYKYPDSQVLPVGSIWNPYVTVKERSKGQKRGR